MATEKRALIVDDEAIICSVCARILKSEGYIVDTASNGIDGQKMVETTNYNLCVLDIRTPGINGIDLYKYIIQKQPPLKNHILFISGDTMSSYVAKFLENNTEKFLTKPFTPEEFREAVKHITQQG